jgi:excinuclease ABC subunit A
VRRFLVTRVCSVCHGTRLRPEALTSQLGVRNIAEISALGLSELRGFMAGLPAGLPAELSRMTTGLLAELNGRLTPLLDVGLSYLTLDRAGASLSTGERQRIELTSYVPAPPACSTRWTSRRSGCTPATSRGCSRRSPPWPGTAIP